MAVWALVNGLDCQSCPPVFQKVRGCRENRESPVLIEGHKVYDCPNKYRNGFVNEHLQSYFHYKNRFLMNEGSIGNQPMKMITTIMFIDRLLNKFSEEKGKNGG